MARKLISVSEDVCKRLDDIRNGRSYSKIIANLLERAGTHSERDVEEALGNVQQTLQRHERLLTQILQLLLEMRRKQREKHVSNLLTPRRPASKFSLPENGPKPPRKCPNCGRQLTYVETVITYVPRKGKIMFDRCPHCHKRLSPVVENIK